MAFDGGKSGTSDSIVILHSVGQAYATKRFSRVRNKASGTDKIRTTSYGSAKHFRVKTVPIDGINALAAALNQLTREPFAFVIRGNPLPDCNLLHTRRLLHRDSKTGDPATFTAIARHWFAVDIDHVDAPALTDVATDPEGAVEHLIGLLPPDVHDATCWWQFTSSQGLPGHEDTLSARLWFWNRIPLGDAELKRWAAVANSGGTGGRIVDPALYSGVQAHYVASPLFERGMIDPVPDRCGVRRGLDDTTDLLIPPANIKNSEAVSGTGYEPGLGVTAFLSRIGPGEMRGPILKAIASYIALNGSNADCTPLKAAIRQAINNADHGGRSGDQVDRYKSDAHLDEIIAWVLEHHGDQPPKIAPPPEPSDDFDANSPPLPDPPDDDVPGINIDVQLGHRHLAADAGIKALLEAGAPVYQRGGQLVTVTRAAARTVTGETILAPAIRPLTVAGLCRHLGQVAVWRKYDKNGKASRVDPPAPVAQQLLDMGEWPLPPLTGIAPCPTLRPDGSLFDQPGYDTKTGLYLADAVALPPIPADPTRADADAALDRLSGVLDEFPFADEASRATALSLQITAVVRGAVGPAVPLHAIRSPLPGSGKSFLVDTAAVITTGERCPVIAAAPNPEETEKRLVAAAIAGFPLISLDNVSDTMRGDFLCQAVERPLLQVRPLGASILVKIPNTVTVAATGNNLTVAADLVRRTVAASLDANRENPETRTFNGNPLATIARNRGRYIADAIIIVRAYLAAGQPDLLPRLPSFEAWSDRVRSALVWLGCADPADTIDAARAGDPVRQARAEVFDAWIDHIGSERALLVGELLDQAETRIGGGDFLYPKLHAALLAVAAGRGNANKIDNVRLGLWLARNAGTIIGEFKLVGDHTDARRPRWQLTKSHS